MGRFNTSNAGRNTETRRAKCGVINGRLTCIPKPGIHSKARKDRLDNEDWKKKGGWFQPRYDIFYGGQRGHGKAGATK